ncbi:MAG: glutamate racemase [Candidatus Gastranaerophilales bacterium]|nr:glutamate racemase [Candidatus Gastranaerophilales bacterium]
MTDNRPIGVYDSGIGGLTVFSKLYKLLPNENYLYFGDTANVPYGTKSREELLVITHKIMNFFQKKNVKAVVMACNTTSAIAYDTLKNYYDFKLYPLIQTACKSIAELNVSKIGSLSTEATANSHAYKNNILIHNNKMQIIEHGCPKKWVEIVENHTQNNPENFDVIKDNLSVLLEQNVERVILGCTHYPYLRDILIKIAGKDIFIDPSETFAKAISEDIVSSGIQADKLLHKPEFHVSSDPDKFYNSSSLFYKIDELPVLIDTDSFSG